VRNYHRGGRAPDLEENGLPTVAGGGGEGGGGGGCPREKREGGRREKEGRERGVRSCMPVQVKANPANRTGTTGGHAM
jgi:hypothetical protein